MFWLNRRREAAWKRTEFMFTQLRFLDTDPGISEAVGVLEGWNSAVTIDDVFSGMSRLSPEGRMKYRAHFDRFFNLLWCVSYAYLELKTITWKEVGGFGWYLWRVQTTPALADYCRDNGFSEVLTAAAALSKKEKWDQDES